MASVGSGWGTTDVRVNEFLVGTLIIDVTDAARYDVVWWGMASTKWTRWRMPSSATRTSTAL
jgi:hypothetical protein